MKNNGVKAFLFAAAAAAVAAFIGYLSGALDPYIGRKPAEVAQPASDASTEAGTASEPAADEQATGADGADAEAQKPAGPSAETAQPEQAAQENPEVPTFDVLRVEGDGSAVVAGKAAPGSTVELFDGSSVLGKAVAGPDGAFAIVLDDPLKAGDHQIVLRATEPDSDVSTSAQTAVVSIPEKPDGQVLAMVEEPGKPAQLLTVPQVQPGTPEAQGEPDVPQVGQEGEATAVSQPGDSGAGQTATGTAASQEHAGAQQPVDEAGGPKIAVEAVEIDGGKIFVAGRADAGRKVRVYANEILLGESVTSPDGHFLVEASRDLPVGEYTIRVDGLDAGDGDKVVVRATVPFQREPGETIAAVAPPAPEGASAQTAGEGAATVEGAASEENGQPATTVAPKLEHADGSVIIRRGDTLWHISRRVYGHGVRYSTIYLANQEQIADPDRIWPGQVFKVPEKSEQGEQADFDAMGDRITVQPQ